MNETQVTTYGGWRRARGIGLFGLRSGQTATVLLATLALLVSGTYDATFLVYVAPPAALAIGAAVARRDGVPLVDLAARRLRWRWASLRGHTRYRGGVVATHPGRWSPPGVLAPTALLTAEDAYGGHYGLLRHLRSGHLTATIRCAAASTWLAEHGDADTWVAAWGGWLASLGHVRAIRWVAVTVDTAPDQGSGLQDQVAARLSPSAPAAARTLLTHLAAHSPSPAATVDTRVSITFDPADMPVRPRGLTESVAEVTRLLPGLQSALGSCGVTVLGLATASELAVAVRTAFDPAARGALRLDDRPDLSLTWADAAPVAADELWDRFRHDSGTSVTWAWHEAPRQHVHADTMARLLAPGRHPRRVTLLYRPLPAGAAARVLEHEVNAAEFREGYRRAQGRDDTARDQADRQRARQAAMEEAYGAGVCLSSMYVTVTVEDESQLADAVADTESRADSARVRLRRMYAAQGVGFATTLPCGIHPSGLRGRSLG